MMKEAHRDAARSAVVLDGSVMAATRADLAQYPCWINSFSRQRKDRRYYELVEDTMREGFDYRYFVITAGDGRIDAIQPHFILEQDILAGIRGKGIRAFVDFTRRLWPGFMRMRTLMVGCAVGEGHLDGGDEVSRRMHASLLAAALAAYAREAKASLIVLKEFPAEYRSALECFLQYGYARIPSLPMVRLDLDYVDFDDYMRRGISGPMRAHLRRKFRVTDHADPIEMSVVNDASPVVDEIYPLYVQVYERSHLHFEKLTKEYLREIGRVMPDRARFFIWRQSGKIIAFSLCLVQDDMLCTEYIGLDYSVALKLHLYFYMFRDVVNWCIANGYRRCFSTSLNYDPKLHLRFQLHPLDLYLRHVSPIPNAILKLFIPFLDPTRYDEILPRFANYREIWADAPSAEGSFPASTIKDTRKE